MIKPDQKKAVIQEPKKQVIISHDTKFQSSRFSIDKFRIEQIILRRIKFVIDSQTAIESHKGLLELLRNRYV